MKEVSDVFAKKGVKILSEFCKTNEIGRLVFLSSKDR